MASETELREHSRYATFRKGTSNKFYQIRVIENDDTTARVIYTWGRIGAKGQQKEEAVGWFDSGVRKANEQFKKKLKKGYVEQKSSLVLLAMQMEEPEERKGNGLPPVEVEFVMPSGISRKLTERLDKFARKFLSKLNLVRKDYYALTRDQYEDQIEDLGKQFCAEFYRICGSKSFGAEAGGDDVKQAIIYYYRALREETKLGKYVWPMRNFPFRTGLYD